jgi:hypothetical protein
MRTLVASITLLSIFAFPFSCFAISASDTGLSETGHEAGFVGEDGSGPELTDFVVTVINTVLGLTGLALLILVTYGGIMWMVAGGEKDKVTKARQLITNAVVGLIIVVGAYAIAEYVIEALIIAAS